MPVLDTHQPTPFSAEEPPDERRYVTFADVLAFRQLVRNNDHRRLVGIFSGDVRLIAEFGATGGIATPGHPEAPETEVAMLNMRIVSDSIILWTDGNRPAEFAWLLIAMRNLLKVGFGSGVPVRAAMAYGELTHYVVDYGSERLGSDTLLGRALVEAYEGENCQQWAGGVVLDSAINNYAASAAYGVPTVEDLLAQGLLVRYNVPRKDEAVVPAYAVNSPAAFDQPLTVGVLEWAFTHHGKSLDGESARRKFENTVAFVSSLGLLATPSE